MSIITNRISPDELNGDAVVPQAADNQFINEETYKLSLEKGLSYQDKEVRDRKKSISHAEFVRSLVYSSQVVVNRAFLFNNLGLYHSYSTDPSNRQNAVASATLLREGAIIPFLFGEGSLDPSELDSGGAFGKDDEGFAAYRNLVDLADQAVAVGFESGDPAPSLMQERFQSYLVGLRFRPPELLNITAAETLSPTERGDPDVFQAFSQSIKELGVWADKKLMAEEKISREAFYADHLVNPESNVSLGEFRKSDDYFAFVKKRIVDLRYNSNLPDAIQRFTFTPQGMPTRSALADEFLRKDYGDECVENLLAGEIAAREFHANVSKAMHLPQLDELTMTDVYAIRGLEERAPFLEIQQEILQNPTQIGTLAESYQVAFADFQAAISRWYTLNYPERGIQKRFESFATVGIEFGGHILILGAQGVYFPGGDPVGHAAIHAIWSRLSGSIKGISIKLMNKVYDHELKRFDPRLSFSIEQMRSQTVYSVDEIRDLLQRFGYPTENLEPEAEQEQ